MSSVEAVKSSIEKRIERSSIATSGSGGSLSENSHLTLKQTLLSRLLDAVKQCQGHFGRKKTLASDDTDTRICFLLAQLEAIFHHGMRKSPSTLRHITEIVARMSLSDAETETSLWALVRCILSEEETKRFLRLNNVNSDVGRGRAWIRNCLNERTLQKSIETILNSRDLLEQFYEEWGFLRDSEMTATLPQIAQGLSTIVFAIGIDNPELNSAKNLPLESSDLLVEARRAPQPIMSLSQTGKRPQSKDRTKRRRKPLVNVVSFDDSKQKFSESEGTMKVQRQKNFLSHRSNSESLASLLEDSSLSATDQDGIPKPKLPIAIQRSISIDEEGNQNVIKSQLPEVVLRSGATSGSLSRHDSQNEDFESVFSEALSDETPSASGLNESFDSSLVHKNDESNPFSAPSIDSEGVAPRLMLLEGSLQLASGDSVSNSSRVSNEATQEELASSREKQQTENETIEYLRAELDRVKQMNEDLSISFEAKLKASTCENELLRNQLRGYVEAIQALKSERRKQIDKEEEAMTENGESAEQGGNEASEIYEQKLIQVAQMHAELMEFNDHLMRDLNRKKRKIVRLRDELTELRGPLLEDYSGDEAENGTGQSTSEERKRQPLVNIWIPSTFMTGKGTDVHSVYQVYVRIRNAEWNVYRRYKDFYEFHQKLKKEDSKIAQFSFPPKKTIGKKEKKFIEERRKQLESYLRSAVNYAIAHFPEFSAIPVNKETLTKQFIFFGDGPSSRSGSKVFGS